MPGAPQQDALSSSFEAHDLAADNDLQQDNCPTMGEGQGQEQPSKG